MATRGMADEPDAGLPPAGLTEPPPSATRPPAPRPGRVAWLGVGLGVVAGLALWAAFTGIGPARFDAAALDESIEERSAGLTTLAVAITNLGSTLAMAVLAVLVGAFCWWRGRRADAVLAVVAMGTASLVFTVLKRVLDRARPPTSDRLVAVGNESLPSGHATMSVVVIGTVVVLVWAGLGVAARVAAVLAAAAWVGAVGATRVYLGVHWFSDVIAGWLLGAAWLAVCVAVWAWWRRHAFTPPT
jgi:membrane-associated phospholipid phosphatase